ncbi:J domain-containing protein [Devosia sp.]|uniref:J domain-containing protein n=1 Tax=Devosia sp. TaxID=1871048 RepID=UPI002FC6E7BC
MTYFFIGGALLLAALAVYQYLRNVGRRQLMRGLRWVVGGGAALLAVFMLLARRIDIAIFVGAVAFSVLSAGRLGSFSFEGTAEDGGNVSKVTSYRFAMELDHDTGAVTGRVLNGQFAGADLMDLGEMETRTLLAEVEGDPDSLSLLESWLDANRSGWREYFAGTASAEASGPEAAIDPLAEAYEVLGLEPGASDEAIRAAHRELMKALHPDHGGSSYLASKINEARDRLLRH